MLAYLSSFQLTIINNTAVNIFVWKSLSFFWRLLSSNSHIYRWDYSVKGGHTWSNRVNLNQVSLTPNSPIFNPNKEKWEWGLAGTWQECNVSCLHHDPPIYRIHPTCIVLLLLLLLFFWPHHIAWGILVPWPGVEPTPSAVEAWSFNHWTSKEVQDAWFLLLAVNKTLWVQPCHFWQVVTEDEEN